MLFWMILVTFTLLVKADLRSEFEERIEKFIQANLESEECDMWTDLLRLEFGAEDKFCQESFIRGVNQVFF